MNYIFGKENFRTKYRSLSDAQRRKIWIIVHTSDNQDVYLDDYDKWLTMQSYCDENNLKINAVSLQYRSHVVKIETVDCDGVYLTKTAKGQMGGQTKHCYGVGLVCGNKVKRTLWTTPELIKDLEFEDDLNNCLEKALVLYGEKK